MCIIYTNSNSIRCCTLTYQLGGILVNSLPQLHYYYSKICKMELSYYHGASADPLCYSTYWSLLDRRCDEIPDKEAVIFYDNDKNYYRKTFGELREEVWHHAGKLLSHFSDLEYGDRIAVVGSNRPEIFLIHLVALRLGLSVKFIPSKLKSGEDLSTLMETSKCKGIFTEDTSIKDEFTGDLTTVERSKFVIVIGKTPEEPAVSTAKNIHNWESIFGQGVLSEEILLKAKEKYKLVSPESDFASYYTSGSTGRPKEILWSQTQFLNNSFMGRKKWPLNQNGNTKTLCDRPSSNILFGFVAVSLIALEGSSVVILQTDQTVNSSDPETLFNIIEKEGVTDMMLFGYMMYDFVKARHLIRNRLQSLRIALVAGQMYNKELASLLQEALPELRIIQSYGTHEVGGLLLTDHDTTEGFIGKPQGHVEVKIINSEGKTVIYDEPGELCCRGPTMMVGYVSDGAFSLGRDQHGWYHTDDSAVMNKYGEIKLLGRMSDVIKRATVLIFPSVIENVIAKHPKIEDVQVVGVSDPRVFEEICACVVASDPTLTEEELNKWCATNLHSSLVPRFFILMKEFPRAVSTKTDRKQLKALAEKLHGKAESLQ